MATTDTSKGGPGLAQQRHIVTEIPGPASRELFERRQRSVARGLGHVLPVFVTAAGGGVVLDADGNSLIDFGSGIAVTSVGNSAELVVARVTEQVARLTPGDHDKRSALFNSGAEAVENAVKIARHATGRTAVVVFDHAYHGRTNLTMAMTAKNMPYKQGFGPFANEVYRVPMAYPFRWPGGPAACQAEALDVITGLIHTQVGEQNVAAVVIEPIQGEGGFVVPPDGRLVRLRSRRRGARPDHHGQGHRRRVPAGRGDRAGRDDGRRAPGRARRHLRREPRRLRRRDRRDGDHGQGG